MADAIVFIMHRAVTVSDRATTKGVAYRVGDFGDAMDSRAAAFGVREADEVEARENEQKLKEAVDRRVEELRHESAVKSRMEELRREGYRGEG